MVIASATYQCPSCHDTAAVVIYRSAREYVVKAYESNHIEAPLWHERVDTEQNARCWGNIMHLKLTHDYGMTRVA